MLPEDHHKYTAWCDPSSMLMPKGEVLPSSPATQSAPAILVPSSKLFHIYLAENPASNYLYQILGQLTMFSPACEFQQMERMEALHGWWEWEGLFWQICKLKWNHTLTLFCNLLPLTCCKFGNNFLSNNVLAFDPVSVRIFYSTIWLIELNFIQWNFTTDKYDSRAFIWQDTLFNVSSFKLMALV